MQITYPDISTRPATGNPRRRRSPDGFGYCSGALRPPFRSGIAEEKTRMGTRGGPAGGEPAQPSGSFPHQPPQHHTDPHRRRSEHDDRRQQRTARLDHRGRVLQRLEDHGYCAPDRWVTQIIDSFVGQGDEFGTFHPNIKGQISIGTALTSTATELLSP